MLLRSSVLLGGVAAGLEFLALIRLRSLEPHTLRPYSVPATSPLALALFCVPPLALCVLLPVLADNQSRAILVATVVGGAATYQCRGASRATPTVPAGSRKQPSTLLL